MPTTQLPRKNEQAHQIAQKIANGRPLNKDPDAPDANVSGGFNQKASQEESQPRRALPQKDRP